MTSGINLSVLQMDANMPIPSQAQSFTYTTAISQYQLINNFVATTLAPSQNCFEFINNSNAGYRFRQYTDTSTPEGNFYLEYFTDGNLPGTVNAFIDHNNYNTGFGDSSFASITDGTSSAAFGTYALWAFESGDNNTAMGSESLVSFVSGSDNTASGEASCYYMTSGNENSVFGSNAMPNVISGSNRNSVFGFNTAQNQTIYNDCVFLGVNADASVNNLTNAIAIGSGASVGASHSMVLGNGCKIGIGTSTPAYDLDVVGTIRCTGLIAPPVAPPTISHVTLEAGSGTGPSYTLSPSTGGLIGGQFSLTVGTSPAFGFLVTFTLSSALPNTTYAVIFTPVGVRTAPALHTETLGVYANSQTTTQFTLSTTVALTAGATYTWNYFVAN
jgi:hypothetical protein